MPIHDLYVVDMDYANTLPFVRPWSERISRIGKHMGVDRSFGCSVSRTLPLLGLPPLFNSTISRFSAASLFSLSQCANLQLARNKSEPQECIAVCPASIWAILKNCQVHGGDRSFEFLLFSTRLGPNTPTFTALRLSTTAVFCSVIMLQQEKRVTMQNNSCYSHLLMEPIYAVYFLPRIAWLHTPLFFFRVSTYIHPVILYLCPYFWT